MINLYLNSNIPKDLELRITPIFEKVKSQISENYPTKKDVDLYIFPSLNTQIPNNKITVSGETFPGNVIFLEILKYNFNELEFVKTIFHEYNHCVFFSRNMQEDSLLFFTIMEGLALNFEREIAIRFNYTWPNYSLIRPVSEKKIISGLAKMIKIDRENLGWNNEDWFYNFDETNNEYPPNFAYAIGEYLIKKIMQKHSISASTLADSSYSDIKKLLESEIKDA